MSKPLEARSDAQAHGERATDSATDPGSEADAAQERERDWPRRIRDGDVAAFEALVRTYTAPLRAYAERQVGSEAVAEEIVEDVFVDIWERRATWTVKDSVRRYLYGAVRRAALHVLRGRRTRTRIHDGFVRSGRAPAMGEPAPAPDEDAEARHLAALLQDAIEQLPDRAREAFLLARQHGLSHAEIAEVMHISSSSVEKNVARATSRLRAVLATWMGEPAE